MAWERASLCEKEHVEGVAGSDKRPEACKN